jgi:hypothetical protein
MTATKHIKQYPHCDPRVLHAPGECKYCDMHPEWQDLRETWGINFTGKAEVGLDPCPADKARPHGKSQVWLGNKPMTPELERQLEAETKEFKEQADAILKDSRWDDLCQRCGDQRRHHGEFSKPSFGVGACIMLGAYGGCECAGFVEPDEKRVATVTHLPPTTRATATGRAPTNPDEASVPDSRQLPDGQYADHWVLPEEERAKGFVRPVRLSYRHVGNEVIKGCGGVTTMGKSIAETYARQPTYYGTTYCSGCHQYLRVGATGEFVWEGTAEKVGT